MYGAETTNTQGGRIDFHPGVDYDTDIGSYRIQVDSDDFQIGPSTDEDAFKFTAAGAAVTAAFNVGLTGTTIDATTDFTVGGTVITDNTITDDGLLWLTTASGVRVNTSAAAGNPAILYLGVSDSHNAIVYLYADDNTSAPFLNFQVPPDNDGNSTTNWIIGGTDNTDDFVIGANNDTDMLKFIGGATPTIQATCAFDVDAALTATTVDADSDFTVGSTVITDGVITDATGLQIAADVTITGDLLTVGTADSDAGRLFLYGDGGASTQGGDLYLYTAADHDDNVQNFSIQVSSAELWIGPDINQDVMKFLEAGTVQFTAAVDVDAALTATTVDADTDFTVGGTVITDNTITDDGILLLVPTTAVQVQGGSSIYLGTNDTTAGVAIIYGDNGTNGGTLRIHTGATGDDGGLEYFDFAVDNDDLWIGPGGNTDALKFVGTGGNDVTIQSTVAFDVDAALTATTVDADTDFTVGSTVITDGVITDATGLSIAATTNFNNNAMTNVDINSGAIDGTTIGAASATTGIFTTVNATTDVTLNSDAKLELTMPAADAKATAITIAGQDLDTNAEGTAGRAGGIVYLNSVDTAWDTADHDTLAESGPVLLAMVPTATASADPTTLMTYGLIKETSWSWTVGAVLYLGNAGAMTETAPTTDGEIIRIMGHAVDATTVMFNPSPDWIVYSA
jgi:hypothetical protein